MTQILLKCNVVKKKYLNIADAGKRTLDYKTRYKFSY